MKNLILPLLAVLLVFSCAEKKTNVIPREIYVYYPDGNLRVIHNFKKGDNRREFEGVYFSEVKPVAGMNDVYASLGFTDPRLNPQMISPSGITYPYGKMDYVLELINKSDFDSIMPGYKLFIEYPKPFRQRDERTITLMCARKDPSSDGTIPGWMVKSAAASEDENSGAIVVEVELNSEGSKMFADMTAANVGRSIAIIYDGIIISAPLVNNVISEGKIWISGNFKESEAQDMASYLNTCILNGESHYFSPDGKLKSVHFYENGELVRVEKR